VSLVALLSMGVAACAETPSCPDGGSPREVAGETYCVYTGPVVIIGGFTCPPELPYATMIAGGVVCTESPTTREDLPPALCGSDCTGVIVPPGAGRWAPLPTEPARAEPGCVATRGPSGAEAVFVVGGFESMAGIATRTMQPRLFEGGAWRVLADPPLEPRTAHAVVEVAGQISVFGGSARDVIGDGATLDLATGAWTPMEPGLPRSHAAAVSTGRELLVHGGYLAHASREATSRLDAWTPGGGGWRTISAPGAPSPRGEAASAWTGSALLVWGGSDQYTLFRDDGAVYDAASETWTPMAASPLAARAAPCAAWTGRELLVWGGRTSGGALRDGAAYDPSRNTWRRLASEGAPSARSSAACVFTGRDLVVFGGELPNGSTGGAFFGDGAAYDVALDAWRPLASEGAPSARSNACATRFGEGMWLYGGNDWSTELSPGGVWVRE